MIPISDIRKYELRILSDDSTHTHTHTRFAYGKVPELFA